MMAENSLKISKPTGIQDSSKLGHDIHDGHKLGQMK